MATKEQSEPEAIELSEYAKKVQRWYQRWHDAAMVENAVAKGRITQAEADEILSEG